MEILWTFWGGEETASRIFQDSSFSGATLEGEKLKISSRKKREKNHPLPPLVLSVRL